MMWPTSVAVFSALLSTALSVPVPSEEEIQKVFHGEDFHIYLRSLKVEVTFRDPSAPRSQTSDEPLMREGKAVSTRAKLNSRLSHLTVESVKESDEGLYTIKDPDDKEYVKRIRLIVRDCSNEQSVKYGDNYHIPLNVSPPITLEYRPLSVEANQTSKPALVLMTASKTTRDGYQDRIVISEKQITLRSVTGADEGSYAVLVGKGDIHWKMCLNVIEHLHFLELPQGKRMKINLILNSSLVQMHYTRNSDPAPRTPHLLLDKGNFTNAQSELGFDDRISLEGNVFVLDDIRASDAGVFKVTDILGFTVTIVHLDLKPFKLEKLYVAIIALLAFVVFLLLACLISCLFKVRKRSKRNAALEKLAKEDDGEAFRQVVKNITKLSEESKHSQADTTEKSQSTEVDIKGLEVSSKEVGVGNLETSDSGVGFNTALPLDTDTDAADALPDSEAASITAPAEAKPAAAAAQPTAPPAETKAPAPPPPVAEAESKPLKTSPQPKKAPEPPVETKLEPAKSSEVKLTPAPSPEPKASLSPASPKPSPSPAISPAPESKTALSPSPEKPKPTTPEPITNGTPETGPDLKASPDHPSPKAPKTPEAELKSSGDVNAAADPSKEATVAADSAKTTSI